MNELSLFTGYGGFSMGLRLAGIPITTVGYVEIDEYCQRIIQARIRDGYLDYAPIIRDIRSADFRPMAGLVDIITGGFPCQPHSTAGKRRGANDPRDLWPDTLRAISEVGPRFALLENVPGIIHGNQPYVRGVLGDLADIGYDAQWGLVSAAAVGAPHLRRRWWCLAHPTDDGLSAGWWATEQERQHETMGRREQFGANGEDGDVADAIGEGLEGRTRVGSDDEQEQQTAERSGYVADAECGQPRRKSVIGRPRRASWWSREPLEVIQDARQRGREENGFSVPEPLLGRVADGVADRVDRLTALGNGVVPAVVAKFLEAIGGLT